MSKGQRIAVRRETVVAFLGPAPRGPVNIPVTIRSVDEYLKRFGSPDNSDRLQYSLRQFFDNGGTKAIVVRVSPSSRRSQLSLLGLSGALVLDAVNPGPWEYLRASIDYDQIPLEDTNRFNLVIHRLASPTVPVVEEQEIFSGISVNPNDPEYVVNALLDSDLVRVHGDPPAQRPDSRLNVGIEAGASYVYSDAGWRDPEMLTDYDLVGSDSEGTGLFALNLAPVVDMVCMIPGNEDGDVGPVALFTADRYCQKRNALLLVDPPFEWTNVTVVQDACREKDFSSPNVMTYFPRPLPVKEQGEVSWSSALGAIAGALAAADAEHGLFAALEGEFLILRCKHRLQQDLSDRDCGILARTGINALREIRPGYTQLTGLVTFAQGGEFVADWNDLHKRRTALFIIESIARGTRWAAFESNGAETWAGIREQTENFLQDLFIEGALAGSSWKEAYYVICDRETNRTGQAIGNREAKGRSQSITFIVGFALREEDLLAFRFVHDIYTCEVREIGWQPGIALAS